MVINLIKGIIIGIVCGLPIGAAGAMTIQRTLKFGVKQGLITGLGASLADTLYAGVGVFGLKFVSDFLKKYTSVINAAGGCFVIFIAFTILRKKQADYKNGGSLRHFLSAFTVGITNPVAIVAFLIAFSCLNAGGTGPVDGTVTLSGVFAGTYLWWLTLTGISCLIRKKSHDEILRKLNIVCGVILIIFGIVMIGRGVLGLLNII